MVSAFISFCIITNVIFAVSPKKLHLFENIFTWMILTYVKAIGYFAISLNEEMLLVPKQLDKYWIFIIGSYTLVPVIVVGCQNILVAVHSLFTKIGIIIACVMFLIAIESWEVAIHILERRDWHFYQSFLFWLIIVLVITGIRMLFHHVIKHEVET